LSRYNKQERERDCLPPREPARSRGGTNGNYTGKQMIANEVFMLQSVLNALPALRNVRGLSVEKTCVGYEIMWQDQLLYTLLSERKYVL
jgi:hypothetical protein